MAELWFDENVSPSLPGVDGRHVNDLGLRSTPDPVIMLKAAEAGATVITHDSDFVDNLRALGADRPSVIHLVQAGPDGITGRDALAERLREVLPTIEPRLRDGAAVHLSRVECTVTELPLARRVDAILQRAHDRRPEPPDRGLARRG